MYAHRLALMVFMTSALAIATPAGAASQDRYQTLDLGKQQIRYALILPDGFDPAKTYPALLALPPGAQNEMMVEAALDLYWEREAKKRGWIVVSPINPGFANLFQSELDPLGRLMDDISARYKIEGGTFHLAGVSNGGRAAFLEALHAPGRFASLLVLPGVMDPGTSAKRIKALGDMAVVMFVGADDTAWATEAQRTLDALKKAGIQATLTVRAGEGHRVSVPPEQLFDVLDTSRPERPAANPKSE